MRTVQTNKLGGAQGDVPIFRVDEVSPNGKPTAKRIVAYGETTGHHHEIRGLCEVLEVEREIGGQLFPGFEVIVTEEKPGELFHKSDGDHDVIQMTPGIYFIPAPGAQQVSYDGEQERRVLD